MLCWGGQPDVLPALFDSENDQLYLTTERAEWQGDWIGDAMSYRLLDAELQPVTDWTEWERIIDLTDEIIAEAVYIEFLDENDNRAQYEIPYEPKWTSIPLPEDVVITEVLPTPTPGESVEAVTDTTTDADDATAVASGNVFSTNTPVPQPTMTSTPFPTTTPFPTFTPTFTPQPGSALMIYDDNTFTLYNNGATPLDLTDIAFQGAESSFVGRYWEEVTDILNIAALPSAQCVMIVPESDITYDPPAECVQARSIVQEPDPRYFWLGEFQLLNAGEVVATCSGDEDSGSCEVVLD